MQLIRSILFGSIVLVGTAQATPLSPASTVSPGGLAQSVTVSDPCTTYSWGATPNAQSYEILVYDAAWNADSDHDSQLASGIEVLRKDIAAPASSWTPAGDQCLLAGGSYVWFLRAHAGEQAGEWSVGRLFEVDLENGQLADAVERELFNQLQKPETWSKVLNQVLQTHSSLNVRMVSAAKRQKANSSRTRDATKSGSTSGLATQTAEGKASVTATFPNSRDFRISGSNGVVFDDPAGLGSPGRIPAEGPGSRFMWYPAKRALRAGHVTSTQWDDANVGLDSIALGWNSTASGESSIAIGEFTTATFKATAMGFGATANARYSTAIGTATTSGLFSIAMGVGTNAKSYGETAIGLYPTDYVPASAIGWESSDRLFVIGNGRSSLDDSLDSDAMVVLKNGNVGFGTSTPDELLHIEGDNPRLLLFGENSNPEINFRVTGDLNGDRWAIYKDSTGGDLRFFQGGDKLTLEDSTGRVGIGTTAPDQLLSVNGNASKVGGGSWATFSDRRLKDIGDDYALGLDVISKLKPVYFRYKAENPRGLPSNEEYVGFIAQQVQQVIPDAVTVADDGHLRFDMHLVNVAMVNAIRELKEQNQAQNLQVQVLTELNRSQQKKISRLEQVNSQQQLEANASRVLMETEMAVLRAEMRQLRDQVKKGLPSP
jgi:hypothetical protein